MYQPNICKVCFISGLKIYSEKEYQLESIYNDLLGASFVISNAGLYSYFCYECAALLYKFKKFKDKCNTGREIIKHLLDSGLDYPEQLLQIKNKEMKPSLSMHKVFYDDYDGVSNIELDVQSENFLDISFVSIGETISEAIEDEPAVNNEELPIDDELGFEKNEINNVQELNTHRKRRKKGSIPKKINKKLKIEKMVEKVKFAKQKSSAYKFDPEKWKIVNLTEEEMIREFRKRLDVKSFMSTYKCEYCHKNFMCEDTLLRHSKVHNQSRGKYECLLCKRRFVWQTKLKTHMKTHQIRYHCKRCPEVCRNTISAKYHEMFHEGVEYKCKLCDLKFIKKSTYYTHLREMHRSQYICAICGASFVSEYGLSIHRKRKHVSEPVQKTKQESTSFYCNRCHINFESQSAFEMHKNNSAMHIEDSNDPGLVTSKKLLKVIKSTVKPSSKDIPCELCGAKFKKESYLERHKSKMHGDVTSSGRCICEICGASLAPSSMPLHMSRHRTSREYPCATCGKVFFSSGNRSRHTVTHTGEKPFQCKICDKKYTQHNNLKLHMQTCHSKLSQNGRKDTNIK